MIDRVRRAVAMATAPAGERNPYTCRLLIRIDAAIWTLRGRRTEWRAGTLCERMPLGHGVELRTHFPGKLFALAADLQNRHFWTRKVLSA